MRRGLTVALLATTITAGSLPAVAGSASSSKSATIRMTQKVSFVPNRYIKDEMRFSRDVTNIRSGGTIKLVNKTSEPHTFSLVKKSELPRTMRQFGGCFEGGACGRIFQAHEFPEGDGPPKNMLVDKGAAGFDQPGDSLVIDPKKNASVKITRKKGALYVLCAIHPWMQSRVNVK